MSEIPASLLEDYRATSQLAENQAGIYVYTLLIAWLLENPTATVEQIRVEAIQICKDALAVYGETATGAAAILLDQISALTGQTTEVIPGTGTTDENLDSQIRYLAKYLVSGDTQTFIELVAKQAQYWTSNQGFQTLYQSSSKTGRWARVPSGRETCGFCLMLASRSYVYHSEKTAGGKGNSYHRHCDCVIVPYTGVEVEGYDPAAYMKAYEEAVAEVDSRDLKSEWAAMSEAEKSRYKGKSESQKYTRFRYQQIYKTIARNAA